MRAEIPPTQIVSEKRVAMFKLPEFPSLDFSALDLNALRESALAKRITAFDTDKVAAALRDAAYVTVGLGVVAVQQVRGLIRSAA
ncbi:MAG: hypothetical protein QOE00_484 [Ilumatobacteraceae bacterium]